MVGLVLLYSIAWLIFDPASFGWHGIATIATLLMTLFIQRAEHRDTQAIHAKLDELLRVNGDARNQLTSLDDQEPEQAEVFRTNSGSDSESLAASKSGPQYLRQPISIPAAKIS